MPENWVQHPVVNTEAGSNPGAPLAWGSPENPDDVVAGYGYVAADTSEVEETFYYHSDHLGSTAYITDQKANVTQYDAYLPYGELLVDEHSSSADLPYRFNGKELDEETGLYYYGARYMNPVTSMWYGVDPLCEEYVASGAYVYCVGNPITLIDPDGQKGLPHSIAGYFKGVYNSISNTVEMVKHPLKTAKAVGEAVMHPKQTARNMYYAAKSRYNEFNTCDDGHRRGEIAGEAAGDIAQLLVGGPVAESAVKGVVKATASTAKVVVYSTKALDTAIKVMRSSNVISKGEAAVLDLMGEKAVGQLKNFRGTVKVIELTNDVKLSRYYGGNAQPVGRYLSNGPISKIIDRVGLALPGEFNLMSGVAEIMVPKGTKMIKGTVGAQAKEYGFPFYGGRTQYYSPSLENFVRVK